MTAASTRPTAPRTDGVTPDPSTSTVSAAIFLAERLGLDETHAHLAAAADALDGRYAWQTTEGHSYVGAGHDAIRLIDVAMRELYRVRGALIGELRADADERAIRVDRIIAEFRARRSGALHGGPDRGAPQDGGAA